MTIDQTPSASSTETRRTEAACGGRGRARPASVWLTGQRAAPTQRGSRYVTQTTQHPARMLPAVAAHAIASLTEPGDVVLDPMCGAGTTLIEALRLGRHAVGIDVEAHWAAIARANIAHTHRTGIGGHAHVLTADSRALPDALPPQYRDQLTGQVALVLTSPPYGAATHGQVRGQPGSGVVKWDYQYATRRRPANLAHLPLHRLLAGLTHILAGCLPLLAPGGHVAITARPWREYGELVDLPGAVADAAIHAGLQPVQRCVALLGGLRNQQIINRASFFQRAAVGKARAEGLPWHLICHEDVYILRKPTTGSGGAPRHRAAHREPATAIAAAASPTHPGSPIEPVRSGAGIDSDTHTIERSPDA